MKRAIRRALVAACLIPIACAARNEMRPAAGGAAPSQEEVRTQAQPHVHEAPHELPATAGPGYTTADVRFMQNMIGHHAQAITMAAMVPTHGAGSNLQRLGQKIDISQRDEIAFMKRWLGEREQAVPDDAHAHTMSMPGMLTPEQLAQLGAARGTEFERLFLTFMIQHHQGALQMVDVLFDSPGAGQDSEIFRFATDVDADQRDEIFVMGSMLDMLDTNRGSRSR